MTKEQKDKIQGCCDILYQCSEDTDVMDEMQEQIDIIFKTVDEKLCYQDGHEVKKLIEEAYQTKVIEEHRQGSDCEWVDEEDEPREVRFKFRVPRRFKIDKEKKLIVYGAIDSLSENWGQMYCPDVKWGIKFVKDGEYSSECDFDQIEFQIYFWISYGS